MILTPLDTSPPIARLDNVGQRFGATVALRDISLAIPARRMVGLIGPDGVGKSSLLSLIAGARAIEQGNDGARRRYARRSSSPRGVPEDCLDAAGSGEKPLSHPLGV